MTANFWLYIDEDRVRVKFVSARKLGLMKTGHALGGDYGDNIIRLPRFETTRTQAGALLHELGHYLYTRSELRDDATEEQIVDLLAWLPGILRDPDNGDLRAFLKLRLDE